MYETANYANRKWSFLALLVRLTAEMYRSSFPNEYLLQLPISFLVRPTELSLLVLTKGDEMLISALQLERAQSGVVFFHLDFNSQESRTEQQQGDAWKQRRYPRRTSCTRHRCGYSTADLVGRSEQRNKDKQETCWRVRGDRCIRFQPRGEMCLSTVLGMTRSSEISELGFLKSAGEVLALDTEWKRDNSSIV